MRHCRRHYSAREVGGDYFRFVVSLLQQSVSTDDWQGQLNICFRASFALAEDITPHSPHFIGIDFGGIDYILTLIGILSRKMYDIEEGDSHDTEAKISDIDDHFAR